MAELKTIGDPTKALIGMQLESLVIAKDGRSCLHGKALNVKSEHNQEGKPQAINIRACVSGEEKEQLIRAVSGLKQEVNSSLLDRGIKKLFGQGSINFTEKPSVNLSFNLETLSCVTTIGSSDLQGSINFTKPKK